MSSSNPFQERPRPYHPDTQRAIDMITMKSDTKAVGSFKYAVFKYPSDVDIMERVTIRAADKRTACGMVARRIRQMVIRLCMSSPRIYLADFKAGRDKRFYDVWTAVKTLKLQYHDTQKPLEPDVVNNIRPFLENLVKDQILSKQEVEELLRLTPPKFYTAMREKYVLRWKTHELCSNPPCKVLPGNVRITLQEALNENERLCKIDVWAPVRDGFSEVENVLEISYITPEDNDGETKPISKLFWKSYASAMCHEVRKNFRLGNYFKTVKRTWFLAKEVMEGKTYPKALRSEAELYIEKLSSSPMLTGGVAQLALGASKLKCARGMLTGMHPSKTPMRQLIIQIITGMDYIWDAEVDGKQEEIEPNVEKLYQVALGSVVVEKNDYEAELGEVNVEKLVDCIDLVTDSVNTFVCKRSRSWAKENLPDLFTFVKNVEAHDKQQNVEKS